MPPTRRAKKPQKNVLNSHQSITIAFKKLSEYLHKAQKTEGEIDCPELVKNLWDLLRDRRQTPTPLESKFVTGIISELEQGPNDMCSRLGVPLFSLITETILQTDYCLESERGLYLLAATLQLGDTDAQREQDLEKAKSLIGSRCLDSLMLYFVNMSNHVKLRRWVGMICIKLLDGCQENFNKIELGPEENRRKIGQLITQETNEILRIICGRLIRVMRNYGAELEDLWPINPRDKLYQGFPSTAGDSDWDAKFQNYIDDVFDTLEEKDRPEAYSTGDLYFGNKCDLVPSQPFGPPDHKVDMLMAGDEITIMVTSSDGCRGEILDVALRSIGDVKVILETRSQDQGNASILLQLQEGHSLESYVNGKSASLEGVYISARLNMIKAMQKTFSQICPNSRITEEYHDSENRTRLTDEEWFTDARLWSPRSIISLNGLGVLETNEVATDEIRKSKSRRSIIGTDWEQNMVQMITTPDKHQEEGRGISKTATYEQIHNSPLDLYSASPPPKNTRSEVKSTREVPGKSLNTLGWDLLPMEREHQTQTGTRKGNRKIRPKAKPPIKVPQVVGLDSNGGTRTKLKNPMERQKNKGSLDARDAEKNDDTNVRNSLCLAMIELKEMKDSFESKPLWRLEENDASARDDTTSQAINAGCKETESNANAIPTYGNGDIDSAPAGTNSRKRKARPKILTTQAPEPQSNENALYELQPDGDEHKCIGLLSPMTKCYPKSASKPQTARKTVGKKAAAKGKPQNQRHRAIPKALDISPSSSNTPKKSASLNVEAVPKTLKENIEAEATIVESDEEVGIPREQEERQVTSGFMKGDISTNQIGPTYPGDDKENSATSSTGLTRLSLHKGVREIKMNRGVDLATKLGGILDLNETIQSENPLQIKADNMEMSPVRKTPSDAEKGGLLDSKKRKAGIEEITTPKKRQANPALQDHGTKPLRQSRGLETRSQKKLQEVAKSKPSKSRMTDEEEVLDFAIKEHLLDLRAQHRNEESCASERGPSHFLVRKVMHIEAPVTSFDKDGPLNQGNLCRPGTSLKPPNALDISVDDSEEKRTPEQIYIGDVTPQRRWQCSPVTQRITLDKYEKQSGSVIPSSSPNKVHTRAKNKARNSKHPRTSSQVTRVDKNGSPHAPSSSIKVDYISKAKQKLEIEEVTEIEERKMPFRVHKRRSSEIFGPKVRLQSQVKPRLPSPGKCEPRYVPHQKNRNGQYEEIDTNHIIQPQAALPDPFVGPTRKSSGFEDRLEICPRGIPRLGIESGPKGRYAIFSEDDPERTLVDSVNVAVQSTPSLTSRSTVDSHSSELSKSPLKDITPKAMWNLALRPHYTAVTDAVHRIADELVIQLSSEENRMDLLVDQYKENGGRIIKDTLKIRAEVKSNLVNSLEEKKDSMINAYGEAKDTIIKTKESLKQEPLCAFEKDWQKKQDLIRGKLSGAQL